MTRRRWLVVAIAVFVVVGLVGAAAVAGQLLIFSKASPPAEESSSPSPSPSPEPTSAVPAGFVEFRHEPSGFALGYPQDWARLQSTDPQIVLLAARTPQESFLVRVFTLDVAVGPNELPAMKTVTDRIVMSGPGVKLLAQPAQIQLGGLPGYFYFYSFQDPGTGKAGAHSHYFIFKGQTMIMLVFQALPIEEFQRLAPLFDQIAQTFRVLPA